MNKSAKWQKYKYAVASIIVILIFSSLMLSYVAVAISATEPLNNISISNFAPEPENMTGPSLVSFSTGSWRLNLGQGYLNITNTGDQNVTLTLKMSATTNIQQTSFNLGSAVIPNVTINAHSSRIISATVNDKTPIVNWTQKPSGYWAYSCSVQASYNINYLFWHPEVGEKTFDFNNGAAIVG